MSRAQWLRVGAGLCLALACSVASAQTPEEIYKKILPAIEYLLLEEERRGVYNIYADHLNTPRLITTAADTPREVWKWNNDDPFGANLPNENPSGAGTFVVNLRLPGQYFDKETNLHYNMARDYDRTVGRYIQPDPIGIAWDTNPYAYVTNNPLGRTDSMGLAPGDKTFGLPKDFWNWYHRQVKRPGDPDLTRQEARELFDEWKGQGRPGPDSKTARRPRLPRGGGALCVPLLIFEMVQQFCTLNPGDPTCLFSIPVAPNDPCKGNPLCI